MSYDLDELHQKYGLQMASIQFATSSDVAGLTLIPAVTGAQAIIHNITMISSSWTRAQLGRSTAAASSYWAGFAGQSPFTEAVRIVGDSGASIIADLASVAVVTGNGVLRAWYVYQKSTGNALSL